MFAALYSPIAGDAPALLATAQAFSPRVETHLRGRLVLIDIAGLGRIVGDAKTIHEELSQVKSEKAKGKTTIAVAPSRVGALLLAVAGMDAVVRPGRTAAAVGALDLSVFEILANLKPSNPSNRPPSPCPLCFFANVRRLCGEPGGACTELPTLRRWGLTTLGDLAALPADGVAARLGQSGVLLQRLARGMDAQPLVPLVEEARFEASLDLEWPLEDLQPLSFVLTRLLDPLSAALERADRGAAAIVTELTLVTTVLGEDGTKMRDTHVRRLELPAPMRDPRVLRTLIVLDLESHPPQAGIDRVTVRFEPTPARIVQFSLLERAGPQPETIATLVARLTAVMGEGRVGAPAIVDSHAPDAYGLMPFGNLANSQVGNLAGSQAGNLQQIASLPNCQIAKLVASPVLRRFRLPVAARVAVANDRPVRVTTDRIGIKGGEVQQCAGPWRASGGWWRAGWDRDEYDVALGDGAAYRIYRDRQNGQWFIEGILD